MLDPLTSLSLAANVAELITFTHSVIKTGRELASDGTTAENERLQAVAKNTKSLCNLLVRQHQEDFKKYKKDLKLWEEAEKEAKLSNPGPVMSRQRDVLGDGDSRKSQESCDSDDSEDSSEDSSGSDSSSAHTEKSLLDLPMALNPPENASRPEEVEPQNPLIEQASTLADDVIAGIQKLSFHPGQRKRKRDAILPTMKTVIKMPTLRKWHKQLQAIQQPLTLHLATLQYQTVGQALKSLQASPICNEASERLSHLERVQEAIVGMCCDASMGASENIEARIAFATTKAQAPIVLKKTLSLLRSADLTQRILPSLQYDEIHVREDRIPEAHASTFEWVFKKQELGFTDWATHSEDGLYWITGKPGSGKSTLIKFIVGQRRTRKLLEMWSGEKRLCIAHHYFWCSGTSLQKSQYGLLRSILLQLFQQCPELLPRVLPRHIWESRSDFHGRRWTMAELVETTKALRHQEDLGVKFCLFIDGLDEYDGEPSDLVKLLDYISQPSFLKLCVSSRPWNAFTNAYGERKQLAVQSLTQGDLRCYISDTLRDSTLFLQFQQSDPEGAALLLGEVCSKAQGVFLWVYLVGRSLRRGLENNDSLEILLARVREMPDSLDGFFRRMFERVESVYKLQAARILLAAYHADYALPLSAPEHISREIANPNYAMEMRVQADEMVVSHDEIRRARIVLDARCGDLLEASCHGISCLHRTVKDFLRQDEIAPNLRMLAGQKFDVGMCLSRLALAVVKGGEAGDLAMQVGRIIRAESLTSHENLPGLVRLLEDVDDIGEQLFAVGYNDLDADSYAESKLAQDLRDSLAKYTTKAATRRC